MSFWTSFWRGLTGGLRALRKPDASATRQQSSRTNVKSRQGAGQAATERFMEEYVKSSPYRLSHNDHAIQVAVKSRQDLASEIPWSHVLCAAVETKPTAAGLCIVFKSPPYHHFWPISCDGLQDLTREMQRRKLVRSMDAMSETSKRFLRAQLAAVLERRFTTEEQRKAKQLLSQCKSDDGRVLLATAQLSGGDLKKLRKWIVRANDDYRDVLTAAWRAAGKS